MNYMFRYWKQEYTKSQIIFYRLTICSIVSVTNKYNVLQRGASPIEVPDECELTHIQHVDHDINFILFSGIVKKPSVSGCQTNGVKVQSSMSLSC